MTTFNTQYIFTAKTEQLLNKLRTVQAKLAKMNAAARATGESLNSMGDRMLGAGAKITAAITAAAVPIYGFQKETNRMVAASGKSFTEMQGVIDLAQKLGATTEHSASAAMRAATIFAQAGKSQADTIKLMPQALTLATAGNIELADAAEMLTTSVNAFNLPAKDSKKIIDTLAKGATVAKLNLIDFKEMISKTGAVSQLAGMNFTKTSAAFMTLRDAGIEASMAATGLGSLMGRLSKPTAEAKKAFHELGIPIEGMIAKGAKFEDVMKVLSKTNMTSAQTAMIFGLQQQKIGATLVKDFSKYEKFIKQLNNSNGAAKKMQQTMNTGIVGSFNRAKSALEGLILGMGESGLTGALTRILDKFTQLITKLQESDINWSKVIKNVFLVTGALLGLGVAAKTVGLAFTIFSGISATFTTLVGIIKSVTIGVRLLGTAITIATTANPIGAIVAAIAAGATGIYYAIKHWDKIVTFFTSVVNKVKSVYNGIKGFFSGVSDFFDTSKEVKVKAPDMKKIVKNDIEYKKSVMQDVNVNSNVNVGGKISIDNKTKDYTAVMKDYSVVSN